MTALLTQAPRPNALDQERYDRVSDLLEQGLYLQAHQAGREWGELSSWPQPQGLILAGRLAHHLGGPRLSDWLMRRAYKGTPDDADARYYYSYCLLRRRGSYRTWRWMLERGDLPETASTDTRSSWFALKGQIVAALRDFTTAEKWLAAAREISPDSAWIRVCAAYVLESEDRYDDALAQAREALEIRANYRPAVQAVAHLLSIRDQEQAAIELLQQTAQRLESAALYGQLFPLLMELKQYQDASDALQRYIDLSPLLEKGSSKWLAAQRAEVAYYLGDYDGAIEHAENSNSEFHKTVAARLREPANREAKVVQLPVGFVRQHRLTCVPATLSAISRFWSMPADHLQVAEEICYDGTSHYNERKWATTHGWVARDFSVTVESTQALIDRGVPFTFTTVDPASSHLQAIIGYDARRGTVQVRDPYWRSAGESLADKFFEKYQAYGPRGMVLVPQEKASVLEGVELPDVELWDKLHEIDAALNAHRREDAETACVALEQLAAEKQTPEHRLALEGRRRLAVYDSNLARHLAIVEKMATQFPDNPQLQWEKLQLQQHQTKRSERLEVAEKLCADKECHPIFWQHLAEELRSDARRQDEVRQLLLKGIRRWPGEAGNYQLLAHTLWDERKYDEALELYRFAYCLADKDERYATSYFAAARWRKQTGEVLQLLTDRFQRFGHKSFHPARTLIRSYLELDREQDAFATVEAAVKLRPDDGELLLYAADTYQHASHDHAERARQLIEQAKGKAPLGAWRRTSARFCRIMGDLPGALAHWREVVKSQPLAIDAHRAIAQLLAQTEGRTASLAYLQQTVEQMPHCYPLFELWVEWLRDEPSEVRERVMHQALDLNPDDAWLRRELAYLLIDERRLEEAWEHCDVAMKVDPRNPSTLFLRGRLLAEQGKLAEAKAAMRETIAASVDADFAIAGLMELCTSRAERREALQFVQEELVKQFTFGDGLLAYRNYASDTLEPDEVLKLLTDALAARPDLWSAYSAVAQQLLVMNRHEEAWPIVEQATQKFPLTPRLWIDRSLVARARLDWPAELESLENTVRINPSWGQASRALADALERRGDRLRAQQVLEQSVARDPLDVVNHCRLADLQWRLGDKAAALDRFEKAALLEPGYEPAWEALAERSRELGCPERSEAAVKTLTENRPGEARSWLRLAQALDPSQLDERLKAWDKALELNPRCDNAYDDKAIALAQNGRWEEAIACCNPPVYEGHPPIDLRLRHGWIEAERGNLPEAIKIVEAITVDEPDCYPAWARLGDWYPQVGDKVNYLKAAEALVRISPQYEISLGYLAEARQVNDDLAGAKEAYARAFELNPRYEFAGNAMFDLQLEAGELEAAAKTMSILRSHSDDPLILARQVQLAAKQKDLVAAKEVLPILCCSPETNRWPLSAAIREMKEAGWQEAAREIVTACLPRDEANVELGSHWVDLSTAAGDWQCANRLQELTERGRIGERAVYTFVAAAANQQRADHFQHFQAQNADWLRKSTYCWGSIAYGFTNFRRFKDAAAWCRDWREREDSEPWMLVNVVEAFRAEERDAEAIEVSRHALGMPPAHGQHLHALWLASDATLAGDWQAAAELLEQGGDDLDDDYQFLAGLLRAAITQAAAGQGDAAAFRVAGAEITRLKSGYQGYPFEPARQRLYRNILKRIADTRGGLFAKIWHWWKWGNSWPEFRLW